MEAQSKTWTVVVLSAAKVTEADPPNQPDALRRYPRFDDAKDYLLVLELRFHYLGPDGEVTAPSLDILNEKDQRSRPMGKFQTDDRISTDQMNWFMSFTRSRQLSPQRPKRFLKSGEKLGILRFYVDIFKESRTSGWPSPISRRLR